MGSTILIREVRATKLVEAVRTQSEESMAITYNYDPTAIPMGPQPLYQGWAQTTDGRFVFFYWTNREERTWPQWRDRKPKTTTWRMCLGQVADSIEEALEHSIKCGVQLRQHRGGDVVAEQRDAA